MKSHYKIDKPQDYRRIRTEIVVVSLAVFLIIGGLLYVIYDLSKNRVTIDDSENYATLGVVEASNEPFTEYETERYLVDVPSDWIRVNNPEVIINGSRYYPERFQGTSGDHVGRKLEIYGNSIPSDLPMDKVIASSRNQDGHRIIPGEMSPRCLTFTDYPEDNNLGIYPSVWKEKDIEFTCKTSRISNIVGAIQQTQAEGVRMETSWGTYGFLLVYTDHGRATDNDIFYQILESFETK